MAQDMTEPVTEMLEKGLTIMRAENETQQAMAVQKPRDIAKLASAAIEELRAFPEFAKKSYYSIPYRDKETGRSVAVEGPSIKAANALVRHWGNNASGFRVVGADEERIMVQGVFLDYETNMRRTAEMSVSRKFKSKEGKVYFLDATRLNMAIQAGGSKAVRNAILNALPAGLVEGYFAEAKRIVSKGGKVDPAPASPEDLQAVMARLVKSFEGLGVEQPEIAAYVGRHPELETEDAVVAHLQGVLNALEEGATSIDEVFAVSGTEEPITQPQATAARTAPGAGKQAQQPLKGQLPPSVPPDGREMKSRRKGPCESCKTEIREGDAIVYFANRGRAAHRTHFA